MKYAIVIAAIFALLVVSAMGQNDAPVPASPTASPVIEPTAAPTEAPTATPTADPSAPTAPTAPATPTAPTAPVAPTPEATLSPSAGSIFFTVYTAQGCAAANTFFNATVRDDYASCQSITVAGNPAYIKIGCYSNNSLIGTAYQDQGCTTVFVAFGTTPSGTCTYLPSAPQPVQSFLGYCPTDSGNPANQPQAPSVTPTAPTAPTPSGAASVAFSGALMLFALLGVFML